jgi:hypothetical protein
LEVSAQAQHKEESLRRSREYELTVWARKQSYGKFLMGCIVFMVALTLGTCAYINRPATAPQQNPEPDFSSSVGEYMGPPPRIISEEEIDYMEFAIRHTLEKVQRIDVNGDGLINCIDYTIQFWMFYPDKRNVEIIWNKHPTSGWNHLFAKVGIYWIECVAYLWPGNDNHRKFELSDFWPSKWSPTYDVDVTRNMPEIIARRFWR